MVHQDKIKEDTSEAARHKEHIAALTRIEKIRSLIQNTISDPLVMTRLEDGAIVDANIAMLRYLNASLEDVMGKNLLELGIWKSREDRESFIKRLKEHNGHVDNMEYATEIRGEKLYGELSARIIEIDDEKLVFAHIRDVTTERKRIIALEESERLLKDAEMAANLGHWEYNFIKKEFLWSEGQFRILGYNPVADRPSVKNFLSRVLKEDRKKIYAEYKKAVEEKRAYKIVYRVNRNRDKRDKADKIYYLKESGSPVYVDGRLTAFRGITQDITMEYSVIRQLEQAERNWRDTFNAMGDAVMLLDRDKKILLYNKKCRDIAIIKETSIFGYHCGEVICNNMIRDLCPANEALKTRRKVSREICFKDSKKIFYSSVSPILNKDLDVDYMVCVVRDITEQKNTEAMLLHSQKLEAIGTLAGGIAHDFNNILTAISGFTELAMLPGINAEKRKGYLEKIKKSSERAAFLVQQILTFGRKTPALRSPVMVAPMIKEAVQFMRATIPSTIELNLAIMDEDMRVMADPASIHQMVINLCNNAWHAIKDKGTIDIRISRKHIDSADEPEGSETGEWAEIRVADTGTGMDNEILARIFEPYFTTKGKEKDGSGMGLAVVHGIVTSHGGKITVESEIGKGTVFKILLPVYGTTFGREKPPVDVKQRESGKVMVVDDEVEIVELMEQYLEAVGYEVYGFVNPVNALKTFEHQPENFDIIITDLTMPGLSGVEMVKRMKEINKDLPVIMCTGFRDSEMQKDAERNGVDIVMNKPAELAHLSANISMLLNGNSTIN